MLTSTKLVFVLAASLAAVPFVGCASPADGGAGEDEVEGVGQSNDELRSAISCQEKTDTAYTGGSASPIQLIHIGGKPTSKATGHAFIKMQAAADAAGVHLTVTSGFRTMAEQKHLYYCYTSGSCNSGNLAALPGHSNHQNGLALDLSTSSWLTQHAARFGFVRTVPREPWHYEYHGKDPGGPCTRGASTATAASPGAPDPATSDPPANDNGGSNSPPTVSTPAAGGITWVAPSQDSTLKNGFVVKAHANTPGIVKIVYSQGSFDFGRSAQAKDDFALTYTFQYMGEKTLTAKGYDASGALVAVDHVDFTLLP